MLAKSDPKINDGLKSNLHLTAALLISAIFFAVYVLTLRPEQPWSTEDYTLYLMHARNLLAGLAYSQTPYIPNPQNSIISPSSYPPGFSLLLVPVLALFGVSVLAAKVFNAFLLSLVLFTLFFITRSRLPHGWPALIMILCGAAPAFFGSRDAVYSETPFLIWCYVGLIAGGALRRGCQPILMAMVVVSAVAMAILTRTVGVVLAAALMLTPCILPCKHRILSIFSAGAGVVIASLVSRWLAVDGTTYLSYFDHMDMGSLLSWLTETVIIYALALSNGFGLQFGNFLNAFVIVLIIAAIIFGFTSTIFKSITEVDVFVFEYVIMLLVYPVRLEALRYLLPIFPFLILYILKSFEILTRNFLSPMPRRGLALLFFSGLYIPFYVAHDPLARPAFYTADTASLEMFVTNV